MFHLWLVFRFVTSGRRLLNLPSMMALAGMALGVASLTVAMAVVSGFENTLRQSIIDVYGHVMLTSRGDRSQSFEAMVGKIKDVAPEAHAFTPFVNIEGLIARQGKLAGVLLQGIDAKSVDKVLNVRSRVIRGEFSFEKTTGEPVAVVGKALAKRFELELGQPFKVVIPTPSRSDSTSFSPKVQTFILGGVLDLGKEEYDSRVILTDLKSAQSFIGIGENFTGIRMLLDDPDAAADVAARISHQLGPQYWTGTWKDVDRNIFEAIGIEKLAIFLVILVMVVAASFNIASNLFVSVLQKYANVSILRAMGFSQKDVTRVFVLQGLFFGVVGTFIGLLLGLFLAGAFAVAQKYVVLMPVEAYHLDYVGVQLRLIDVAAIVVASILVCLVSTFIPARRGAKLDPVEGLRYE